MVSSTWSRSAACSWASIASRSGISVAAQAPTQSARVDTSSSSEAEANALAERISGHSLRSGYATAAAAANVPSYRIQQHTRHKSADMVSRYVREANNWTKNGLKGVGF